MEEFLKITVLPESKKAAVSEKGGRFFVSVRAKKKEGEANKEALALLAEFLGIPRNKLSVIKGNRTPNKIIKVVDGGR